MTDIDYYSVLGLAASASATDIKARWRELVLIRHPDKFPAHQFPAVFRLANEEEFKRLKQAYDVLSNPQAREAYDLVRRSAVAPSEFPRPYFSPASLDFGEVAFSETRSRTIVLQNRGARASSAELVLSSDASWFSIDVSHAPSEEGYCPMEITVTVRGPGGTGTMNEWLSVSLDGVTAQADLHLTAAPARQEDGRSDDVSSSDAPYARLDAERAASTDFAAEATTTRQTADDRSGTSLSSTGPVAVAVILLLLGVGWLISRSAQQPVSPITSNTEGEAETLRRAERPRVAEAITGVWKSLGPNMQKTLRITRTGQAFSAIFRFQGRDHRLRGELLSDNRLKLSSSQVGKVVNPRSFWRGDFSQESWAQLSADYGGLTIVFGPDGTHTLFMVRVPVRMNSSKMQPVAEAFSGAALSQGTKHQVRSGKTSVAVEAIEPHQRSNPGVTANSDSEAPADDSTPSSVAEDSAPGTISSGTNMTAGTRGTLVNPGIGEFVGMTASTADETPRGDVGRSDSGGTVFKVKCNTTGSGGGAGQYVFLYDCALIVSPTAVTLRMEGINQGFTVSPAKIIDVTYNPARSGWTGLRPEEIRLRVAVQEMDRHYRYREARRDYFLFNTNATTAGIAQDGRITILGISHVTCEGCANSLSAVQEQLRRDR